MWEVTRTVQQADMGWVSLGVLCVLLNIFTKGIRWYKLLGGTGQQAGIRKVLAAFLVGQVLNLIYPVCTGDVSRILVLGKDGDQRAIVLGTVVLEKLADLVSYVLLVLLLLTLLPLPTWLDRSALGITLITVILLGVITWLVSSTERSRRLGLWLAHLNIRWLPASVWLRIIQLIHMTLTAIGTVKHREKALELAGWTFLVWVSALLTKQLVFNALKLHFTLFEEFFKAALLVLLGLFAGIAMPSVPGRIGIFEYICIMALAVFGVEQSQALTYGILLHAVVFLPVLAMGVGALLRLSWKPKNFVPPVS